MDITTLAGIMETLEKKFHAEAAKVDALHPNRDCDTDFMKMFLSTYDYWRIYSNMPEDHEFKAFYLSELEKRIKLLI